MSSGPAAAVSRSDRRLERLSMTIIGAGRAGSFAALAAGMAGVRHFLIYDHDRLDPGRNLAKQLYLASDVKARRLKARALPRLLRQILPGVRIVARPELFEARRDQVVSPFVLLAVDTMAARAALAERLLRRRDVAVLLDLRLGGPVMLCLCARDDSDRRWYRGTLYDDADAWGGTCADAPDPHVAVGAAAFIASAVMAHVRGHDFPRMIAVDFDSASWVVERGPG